MNGLFAGPSRTKGKIIKWPWKNRVLKCGLGVEVWTSYG
jgi:hypothetical protein